MRPEQPMPSPEEMARIEKERTLSDAELLKEGAEYKFNEKGEKRLEVTDRQVEEIQGDQEEKERSERYQAEAMIIAQRISGKWKELKKRVDSDPYLLANDPDLYDIYEITAPPKTGIQRWFESRIESIEEGSGNSGDTRRRMMYRLKEDLKKIEVRINDIIK